ncbi:MAG: hypothetical protein AAB296_01640, partial [Candidatus Desantisbacteria bacterium]
ITVEGSGYRSNAIQEECEWVQINFGTHQTITSTQVLMGTDINRGTFSTTFRIDTQAYGETWITAVGTDTGRLGTTIFFITPEITRVAPLSGVVGRIITMEGRGFYLDKDIYIRFGSDPSSDPDLQKLCDNHNGTFSVIFTANTEPYGTKIITAYNTSPFEIKATSTFVILAKISNLEPTSGRVGQIVTVQGTGFGTGTVRIDFGTKETITTIIATANGTFSTTFTVNTQYGGSQTITCYDLVNPQPSVTTVFNIRSNITSREPANGNVGQVITVTGRGYIGTVSIHFGTHQTITSIAVSTNGTFSTSFIADEQPTGSRVITCADTNSLDTTTFIIRAYIILVSPTTGRVGDPVTLQGTGFVGSETVRIQFGTHQTITTTQATPAGTFSVTFLVSTQPYSTKWITAYSEGAPVADTSIFRILPNIISLDPLQGSVSTFITISGTGFETGTVYIHFGTHKTITTTVGNGNGTFSLTFRVSTQSWGTKTITAFTSATVFSTINFIITSAYIINLTPTDGSVS